MAGTPTANGAPAHGAPLGTGSSLSSYPPAQGPQPARSSPAASPRTISPLLRSVRSAPSLALFPDNVEILAKPATSAARFRRASVLSTFKLFGEDAGFGARFEDLGDLYERFEDAGKADVFLDALIPHIFRGEVQTIPPTVARDLFDHVRSNPSAFKPGFLENMILHLDPSGLDIHSTLGMCISEGWYTASAHIWNKALKDFVSPIVEQLGVIRESVVKEQPGTPPPSDGRLPTEDLPLQALSSPTSRERRDVSYRMFVYLAYVLTGRSYPSGVPMDGMTARTARNSVYSFLLSRTTQRWPAIGGKPIGAFVGHERSRSFLHAGESTANMNEEPPYPYLRMLLRFDPGETLRVFGMAMDDPYMDGEDLFDKDEERLFDEAGDSSVGTRQGIIDALLSMAEETVETPHQQNPTAAAVAATHETTACWKLRFSEGSRVCGFIIRMAAKYRDKINVSKDSLHHAVVTLSTDTDASTHEERQVAIEALWSTRLYVPATQTEQTRLAELYEKAGFYRVLEKIYRQEGRYDLVIESYLADKGRREAVFEAVAELMGSSASGFRLSDAQKAQVRNAAMARLPDLVGIDGWKSAELVKNHLEVPHAEALARLSPDAEKQASLLRGLLEACKFEETFLGITNVLVGRDLFEMVRGVVHGRAKGWRPRHGQCAACRKALWTIAPSFGTEPAELGDEESRSLVVFRCGHGYHRRCLPEHLFDSCLLCRHMLPKGTPAEGVHCGSIKKGKQRAVD